jgi:hypothetical protein
MKIDILIFVENMSGEYVEKVSRENMSGEYVEKVSREKYSVV